MPHSPASPQQSTKKRKHEHSDEKDGAHHVEKKQLTSDSRSLERKCPADFRTHEFDPCSLSPDELINYAFEIFNVSQALTACKVPVDKLRNFLVRVRSHHRANAYHNWQHGFHVLLNTFRFVSDSLDIFEPVEVLGLLLAAVCHDLDHCGVSNKALVDAGHPLALKFGDKSPLENHSVAQTLDIIASEDSNVLCNLSPEDRQRVQDIIRDLILATDITDPDTKTFVRAQFDQHVGGSPPAFKRDSPVSRLSLMRLALLCADIGLVTEPFDIFLLWVRRLFRELRVVDSTLTQEAFHDSQRKFLDLYATPLFDKVSATKILSAFDGYYRRMQQNAEHMKANVPPLDVPETAAFVADIMEQQAAKEEEEEGKEKVKDKKKEEGDKVEGDAAVAQA